MIVISAKKIFHIIALIFIAILLPNTTFAAGADSLTITVTPPLFQITQSPGSEWRSQLRVVNSNNFDIGVTLEGKDFHPNGETGNAVFDDGPKADANDTHRMSGWIETPKGVVNIKRGTTAEIPFLIKVPIDADPGGHYGALLVSTKPRDLEGGSGAGISSGITSLILMRIPGDVVEKGGIRDFYAEDNIVETPDEHFVLRFENQGNVHLVPQGQIVITNMWSKERGRVNINESSTFGNVLPNSTRKFEFSWKETDASPFEVGRYKAVATLVYGIDGRNTVERTLYFWIVPWKPVLALLGGLLFFIWFITWSLRRYIKKALDMEREYLGLSEDEFTAQRRGQVSNIVGNKRPKAEITMAVLRRPITQVSTALSSIQKASVAAKQSPPSRASAPPLSIIKRYRPVIIFIVVFISGISLISWYFIEVFQDERAYHVEVIRPK